MDYSCGFSSRENFTHFAFNNARALPTPLMPACCCLILRDGRVKGTEGQCYETDKQ
jgi:hypothetical protein